MNNFDYQNICIFKNFGTYPTEFETSSVPSHKERDLRRKVASFFTKDYILYKKTVDGELVSLEVAIRSQVLRLLQTFHDDAVHPGINSTFKAIQKRYYCPDLHSEVSAYLSIYLPVQCNNLVKSRIYLQVRITPTITSSTCATKNLQPIPPPDRSWKHLGINLITDLPERPEGYYKHVLVIVCYLSKYVVVRPLMRKTTEEVTENLMDVYLEYGLPDIIQHEQGREFKSSAFEEFHKKLNITQWLMA